ncbi:porin [Sutterella wadsworthensis]|uniref:porin n=1 Tax=Sutterella wadsworthensis TaxID=40545 RepID=UPI0013F647EF|nr:porin [Sutterella wadsworthensis]
MFKKSLAAVALLGAFAGSAFAADVTLYGVVDEGFLYTHKDADKTGVDAVDKLELKSGIQAGSRWGLKGTEDLGNGLKVGFILESGFNADDGTQGVSGTMFNREASLNVMGPFGQLSLGKIGAITQGTSSWGKVGAVSAFGTSYGAANVGNATNVFAATVGVMDNTIAYQTPKFAGFTVYAQYSMGSSKAAAQDADKNWTQTMVENESSTDRYYALGATYANGPVNLYFAVDSVNYASYFDKTGTTITPSTKDVDDSLTVAFGGSYDFSVVKVFAGAQYFDEVLVNKVSGLSNVGLDFLKSKMEGYALQASASAPLAGGTGYFGVGYVDASEADSVAASAGFDIKYYVTSVGYKYDLSKRTNVYGVLSYAKGDQDVATPTDKIFDRKPSMVGFGVGLRHNF